MTIIESEHCVHEGYVVYRMNDENLCWKHVKCPDGMLADTGKCLHWKNCVCPEWSVDCIHLSNKTRRKVTLTQEHLYLGIIIILAGLQIYQFRLIKKLEKECDDIWAQLGTLVGNITSQILSLQKDLNGKEDKK